MDYPHLNFKTEIGIQKPNSIRNKECACPFCDREKLTDILDAEDSILWLKNKYPVLENAFQTVIIESDECESELSRYTKEHLFKLFHTVFNYWRKMETSGEFKSVLFLKNHGPLSGGSIAHPHMQLIGLHDIDYREGMTPQQFVGLTIQERNGVNFSVATQPKVGFYEFNVKMKGFHHIEQFATYIQMAVHYIQNDFKFRATSYNLFFYHIEEMVIGKIVPRFVTTPLYIGYSIPQVPNNLDWVRDDIFSTYFT